MNAIVAVDRNWGIGKDNNLLVHLSGDLKYYKSKTIGGAIIVGRKTLDSFPGGKPLPGRANIVLSRDPAFGREDCIVVRTKEEALAEAAKFEPDRVFVCGGASIYQMFLEDCAAVYVTKIDAAFEADTWFPDLDALDYRVDWSSEAQEEKGIRYRFLRYVK